MSSWPKFYPRLRYVVCWRIWRDLYILGSKTTVSIGTRKQDSVSVRFRDGFHETLHHKFVGSIICVSDLALDRKFIRTWKSFGFSRLYVLSIFAKEEHTVEVSKRSVSYFKESWNWVSWCWCITWVIVIDSQLSMGSWKYFSFLGIGSLS